MVKLRQKPSDFIVEELPNRTFGTAGKFAIYKIIKTSLPTFAAEKVLARHCNVSFKNIGFAGLKDAHGITAQYFSVDTKDPHLGVFQEANVNSECVGFANEPLRTGDLKGNRFEITVRDLDPEHVESAKANESWVKLGVPNFFDSQRFGSLKGTTGFIAKDVLRGDFESAIKKILTAQTKNKKAKPVRAFIEENWGDWESCEKFIKLHGAQRMNEGALIAQLRETNDCKDAFHRVFKGIRELFFSAYQSYIWNECVNELVRDKPHAEVYYDAGVLLFSKACSQGVFPTVSNAAPEERYKAVLDRVLAKEHMSYAQFKTDEHVFVARARELCVVPKHLEVVFASDELFKGKQKAVVKFELRKGSYATIIIKALFDVPKDF